MVKERYRDSRGRRPHDREVERCNELLVGSGVGNQGGLSDDGGVLSEIRVGHHDLTRIHDLLWLESAGVGLQAFLCIAAVSKYAL